MNQTICRMEWFIEGDNKPWKCFRFCDDSKNSLIFGSVKGFQCRRISQWFEIQTVVDAPCMRISPTGKIRKRVKDDENETLFLIDRFKLTFSRKQITEELEKIKGDPVIETEKIKEPPIEIHLPGDLISISHPYEDYILETTKGDFYISKDYLVKLLKGNKMTLTGELMRTRRHITGIKEK